MQSCMVFGMELLESHSKLYILKGALDNLSLIPQFFFKKVELFIPLEVYTYVVTACLILLATST